MKFLAIYKRIGIQLSRSCFLIVNIGDIARIIIDKLPTADFPFTSSQYNTRLLSSLIQFCFSDIAPLQSINAMKEITLSPPQPCPESCPCNNCTVYQAYLARLITHPSESPPICTDPNCHYFDYTPGRDETSAGIWVFAHHNRHVSIILFFEKCRASAEKRTELGEKRRKKIEELTREFEEGPVYYRWEGEARKRLSRVDVAVFDERFL